jgi:hypothetical protein
MTVDPSFTFGVALILSLVLWWPTLRALLAGNVDITDAGMRYLAALGLSWLGVYFITTLVAGYGRDPHPAPPAKGQAPQRRADDPLEPADEPAA